MQNRKENNKANSRRSKSNPKLDKTRKSKPKARNNRAKANEFIGGTKGSNKNNSQRKKSTAKANKPLRSKATSKETNKNLSPNKQSVNKVSRDIEVFQVLRSFWDLNSIRRLNDDFIVDSISGKRKNDLSLWPALSIQRARTVASIGSKIKTSQALQSDEEAINEFIMTQDEPVLSDRYCALVKSKIDEVFHSFPYEAVKAEIKDTERRPIITNGSSSPQLLAPVISGINSNIHLIAAMAAGRKIELSTFHVDEWLTGIADGKLTAVPKNYKKPRIITITSREFIDKQYVPSDALRDWITSWSRTSNHITQFDDQSVQHEFLKEGYATLDLSSASDRIYRSLIERVWPDFMVHFGEYLPRTVSTDQNRIVHLTCIGTQGFPLTFTVMAIIVGMITSAVKTSSLPSANYGDDIVVAEVDFNETYCALEALGLKINKSKTHKSSQGFLESCGRDVMFTRNGPRDVTPIHLRGTTDVDLIQFFYQLCKANLIDADGATSLLSKLRVEYYAFNNDMIQLTEFHFPFGEIKNLPDPKWDHDKSQYICKVPALKQEADIIKGLSKKESVDVMQLLLIEAGLKNPNNQAKFVRGLDPIARPYAIMDLQDNRLFGLYQKLDVAGYMVPEIYYNELESEYNVTFKTLMYYKFITSELCHYRFSTATVDFSEYKTIELSLQEMIDSSFGIKSETKYPIYRYKVTKDYKTITHPKNNIILDV